MKRKDFALRLSIPYPEWTGTRRWLRRLLPPPGAVIFTVLALAALLWAQSVGAIPLGTPKNVAASTGTIAYQGRLADTAGQPLTDTYPMTYRLYSAASGGAPLWEEIWSDANSVQVSDGLFNVMLGSLKPIPPNIVATNSSLFLGISVGNDSEMTPRVQLGSVPFAVQALTVPDGSVTTGILADSAVTTAKLADGAVTQAKLAGIALPKLLGEKTCNPCTDTAQANAGQGWHPVRGGSNEEIAFSAATSGRPVLVQMTARYQTSVATVRWCYVQVIQNGTVVRGAHIDGILQAQSDWGCSGSYLFTNLPAGTYTFRAMAWVNGQVNISWVLERQIVAFEY